MKEHVVKVTDTGDLEFVYHDELADLLKAGDAVVVRASHVEPHPTRGGWLADMRPSGGPVLGCAGSEWRPTHDHGLGELPEIDMQYIGMLAPFELREQALEAEREWLRKERGL